MAFDDMLAARIRKVLGTQANLTEKKMFGGLAFLIGGNMCVGVHRDAMIVRIAPQDTDRALEEQHTGIFDITGRPMKGWILVEAGGVTADEDVARWTRKALAFVTALPAK